MKTSNYILGIETSCDDTSFSILKDDSPPSIVFKKTYGQEDILKKWGGVVPEIAARNHLGKIKPLLEEAFSQTKLTPNDLSYIAVTTHPGLLGPLLTGVNAAKTLSLLFEKPIICVNHLYAHLEAIHLSTKVSYPYLGLLISGGHSIYFWVQDKNTFHMIGTTIDDACGEAFDKGGKILGLGYPAGHIIDKASSFGNSNRFEFPIGLKSSADARLSYSGLKTSLKNFLKKNPHIVNQKPNQFETCDSESQDFYDVCASYQSAITKALLLKMRYAIKIVSTQFKIQHPYTIVVGGGVACNTHIRREFKAKYKSCKFVEPEFCTDNGAMIANYARINTDQAIKFPECLSIDARGRFLNKTEVNK